MLIPPHVLCVSRNALLDNLYGPMEGVLAELRANKLWQQDFTTDSYILRTRAFMALFEESAKFVEENKETALQAFVSAVAALAPELPEQKDGPAMAYFTVPDDAAAQRHVYIEISASARLPAAAFVTWRDELFQYVRDNPGPVLFWRHRPEMDAMVDTATAQQCWKIYSRLVVPTSSPAKISDFPDDMLAT